jgi:SAM-dependent methyltransferase
LPRDDACSGARSHGGSAEPDTVARYYDASTSRFLAVGGSGATLAIHRPLWADGVRSTQDAAMHINKVLCAEALRLLGLAPRRVRDLGCGVGGSVFALAHAWPETEFDGITISRKQTARAATEARAQGLDVRCRFHSADFADTIDAPHAQLAIAIESHVHAPTAEAFLNAAARHLQPGGVLLIVDDMLARPEARLARRDRARIARFRAGWRLGHVPDVDGLIAAADSAGFDHEGTTDFTALIRLNRLRDIVLRVAGPVADRLGLAPIPFFANVIGGNALTESYRRGIMRYTMVALRKHGC